MQQAPRERRPRLTQDERSAATRSKLRNATFDILRESGHAGLRSASVAEVAGVSRGGLLHQYPSKELLVADVFENLLEADEARSWQRIRSTPDDALLSAIVADARERFLGDSFKVMLDILVASGEGEPMEQTLKALQARGGPTAREGWAERLVEAGVQPTTARRVTAFLWNTVKGLGVRRLVRADEALVARVIALALDLAQKQCVEHGLKLPKRPRRAQ